MPKTGKPSSSLANDLRAIFVKAKLPTNPAIAAEILKLSKNPKSTAEQFARVIEADAAMAARLLKMANSALFGQRTPVTTIRRAVTVLGLRRLRMDTLSFQLAAHLNRLGNRPFDLQTFWQQSVLRACLAREVAGLVVVSYAEEAFLIGLLQDCGILLLVQMLGPEYAELSNAGHLSPTAFYAAEQERFPSNHVATIAEMGAEWHLPESILTPLRKHHDPVRLSPDASDLERLSAVSYFVGSMRWTGEQITAPSEPRLREYVQAELGLDDTTLEACFQAAGNAYREVAHLFGDALPDKFDVTDLLAEANRLLSRAASDSDLRARRVQEERDQFCDERATLAHAVAQYREQAARDPLTGLLNRGALVDATVDCLRRAEDQGLSITVMFLDLDNFKRLNDDFGHPAGDEVLKAVAKVVNGAVSHAGCAGRYGGEEFVLVVPGLTEDQARERARSVIRAARETRVAGFDLPRPVTCSLGAVWGSPRKMSSPEALFAASDQLMYHAKRCGKNCGVFRSLDSAHAEHILASDDTPSRDIVGSIATESPAQELVLPSPDDFRRAAVKLNRLQPSRFSNARKQHRQELLTECALSFIVGSSLEVRSQAAFVRNISAGGIALLASRPLVRGDLVEIAIRPGDVAQHLAGMVAFCRHVEGSIHELGVQIVDHAKQPIFMHNPAAAIRDLEWMAQAVREKYGADLDDRRSA